MKSIDLIIKKINRDIISPREIRAVSRVLSSGILSRPEGGPQVKRFQKMMALHTGKKYAFGATSGTAALHLAVSSLCLKKGDEVIVPALANIADCSVVLQEGLVPVFVDIDPADFNIDPAKVKAAITRRTKALIVVHMYGQPARMKELTTICRKHHFKLIEDCAQAAGARYLGKYVGSFGDLSCFSFYQTKHIVCGEGGMVLTNDRKQAKLINSLANNGIKQDNLDNYDYDLVGYNYQLTEIQGALGIEQLKKIDRLNIIRRQNARTYTKILQDTGLIFQRGEKGTENSFFYLSALVPSGYDRDHFVDQLKKYSVPVKKLYPQSLPEVELIRRKNLASPCVVASGITKRIFNLYVNPGLSKKDIIIFAKKIKTVYEKERRSA